MTDVYIVKHISLNQYRVIKRAPRTDSNYQRLVREAQVLQELDHPSIPKLLDLEEDDRFVYLIETYIRGESLNSFFF